MFNGIGGKVEAGESPHKAMQREFWEEAGLDIVDWRLFCILKGEWGKVWFYVSFGSLLQLEQKEDEKVGAFELGHVRRLSTIPNLDWLIPLALDRRALLAEVEQPTEHPNHPLANLPC